MAAAVESLLENMLKKKKIQYLSISSRVKTPEGALEKIKRKEYSDPIDQLTDLSGIRVITFLEEQVSAVAKVITELFDVDEHDSLDRIDILGHDRIGYRSTHFVCTLGPKRNSLPEYESLGILRFEIQVRTVLQHAWAELAHDRSFKFGVALPAKIQRKLNLYSGMLEIVDSAFDEISKEIDKYKAALDSKSVNQILDVEIDSLSIKKFIDDAQNRYKLFDDPIVYPFVVSELRSFGVRNIGDLEKLASENIIKEYQKPNSKRQASDFMRTLMFYENPQKFLEIQSGLERVTPRLFDFVAQKHGKDNLIKILAAKDIEIAQKEPEAEN